MTNDGIPDVPGSHQRTIPRAQLILFRGPEIQLFHLIFPRMEMGTQSHRQIESMTDIEDLQDLIEFSYNEKQHPNFHMMFIQSIRGYTYSGERLNI